MTTHPGPLRAREPRRAWELSDEGVARLEALPALRSLRIHLVEGVQGTTVDRLRGLEELDLTSVSEQGIQAVARLSGLRRLTLDGGCRSRAVPLLGALTRLQMLDLVGDLDDGALGFLTDLPELRELRLGGAYGDPTLARLAGCGRLERLSLVGRANAISDSGLGALTALPLRELFLSLDSPDLTVEGVLRAFRDHPTLRRLSVYGPLRRGRAELRSGLPLVHVR